MAGGGERWALVLGASSGFGAAVSVELARKGYRICGVHLDRRATREAVDLVREEVAAAGEAPLFFNVNAADGAKRGEVLESLSERCAPGGLCLLFHSLAFGSLAPFVGADARSSARASQLAMTLDVMANTLVYWTQDIVWRGLMAGGGRILAMSSAGSTRAMPSYGMVSAAKAALEAYVRQLALELGPAGITANTIRAGVTDTPALRKIPGWESMRDSAAGLNPGGRLTETSDVARLVALLLEPGAAWVSGNVIGADGGEDVVAS